MYSVNLPRKAGVLGEEYVLLRVSSLPDSFARVEPSESWLKAFQNHYNQMTGENAEYNSWSGMQTCRMTIPKNTERIEFLVDWGRGTLEFRIGENDKKAKEIVSGFLDRLFS